MGNIVYVDIRRTNARITKLLPYSKRPGRDDIWKACEAESL